jgi:hypothetical protein
MRPFESSRANVGARRPYRRIVTWSPPDLARPAAGYRIDPLAIAARAVENGSWAAPGSWGAEVYCPSCGPSRVPFCVADG